MNLKNNIIDKFKKTNFDKCNANGYCHNIENNFIKELNSLKTIISILKDFIQGSGSELEKKILAVHSSAMLAVNSFGYFKDKNNIKQLKILEKSNFKSLDFEKKCPTGLRGTPPNLDLVLEAKDKSILAIESKFTEYFHLTKNEFSESYNNTCLNWDDEWKQAYDKYNNKKTYFNIAQIIKHYLGLKNTYDKKEVTLLYLYWKPIKTDKKLNNIITTHEKEIKDFKELVDKSNSRVKFKTLTYNELWASWKNNENLNDLINSLEKRYMI